MLSKCKKVLNHFFPVRVFELKKLIPMLVIFFFIGFIYNILRNAKDTLVVTCQASGAQVIPFIKVWMMLPGAILMTSLFSKLSNRFSMEKVIYLIIGIFLAYFALFTFVAYPYHEVLELDTLGDFLAKVLPKGCAGLISMIRYWAFTTFYVMSELWSCIVLSLLFWGFANEVNTVEEAKRFYGFFGVGMNISGIAAGQAAIYLSRFSHSSKLSFGDDPWQSTLIALTIVILAGGCIILALFRWMHVKVLSDDRLYQPRGTTTKQKSTYKMSVRKNFAYLAKSKYLIYIALIVLSYNLVINLVEVVWKDQIRSLYPNPNDYNIYMNQVTVITGIIATSIAFFAGSIIRYFGWTFSAMICPVIMLITSIGFFTFLFFSESLGTMTMALFHASPLVLVVFFGSVQNCLSRGCKYSLFDATKELSFIPLEHESRKKGKAAIDGVGSRLGKSGGSLIHQGLLMVFASLSASAPFIAAILMLMNIVWIVSTRKLGREFTALVSRSETLAIKDDVSIAKESKPEPAL